MTAEVTLTIDGQTITVPAGTLLIRAAEQLGIYVPRFCDHPLLDPLGACRQCLVEVEGQRKPLTSCTTPVAEGMVVRTQQTSDLARAGQDGVLELLLINHPLDCPMCDKGGECPLQDQALAYGPGGSRYIDAKRRFIKPIPISPLIKLDRERCVLCARCTRFADEISGDPFIELYERGALEQVAVSDDEPYTSVFSGNVIQICPVGALTASTYRFKARPFDVSSSPGVCTRCSSGCSIDVQTRRGEIVRVMAGNNPAVNEEWICDKGRFGYAYVQRPERVTEPMVRKNGELVAVSWAEAIRVVAERTANGRAAMIAGQNGADEDSYALSRFARTVLGTNEVDSHAGTRADDEAGVLGALARTVTAGPLDLEAARTIVIVGTDLREDSPIVYLRARKAARRFGARIIEVGPRRSALRTIGAGWLPCLPGGEAGVLLGIATAMERAGASGLDPWTRALATGSDQARAIAASGGDAAGIEAVATALSEGEAVLLAGERLGAFDGALGLAWNVAAASGARFGWVPRKGGARGAAWAGLHPALLPGGRRVEDDTARAQVEEIWGGPIPAEPGRGGRAVLTAPPEVLFLAGIDPVVDAGTDQGLLERPFVVALDLFLTETTERADVVLPSAASFERDGTATTWAGTAQRARAAVPPLGLAQPDRQIVGQIAEAMGHRFPQTVEALRREMRALSVEAGPAQAVRVAAVHAVGSDASYPLHLEIAADLIDDGTMMAGADLLREAGPDGAVRLHPEDAARLGVSGGARVRLVSAAGSLSAPARLDDGIAQGSVAIPARTRGTRASALTGGAPSTGVRIEGEA